MAKKREIILIEHPVLRKKAKKVESIKSPFVRSLIDDLFLTLDEANGVGIAAPQVSESYRLFIVAPHSNLRYPESPEIKPIVAINPKITWFSKELEEDWEGCLSVPKLRGLVPRAKQIKIAYTTPQGIEKETLFSDFIARIFQHEYDHLQGVVFIDRAIEVINEREFFQTFLAS